MINIIQYRLHSHEIATPRPSLICCMKLVLFRVGNVCEMSTKTFGINDAV